MSSFVSSPPAPGQIHNYHDYNYHFLPTVTMEFLKSFFEPHLDLPRQSISPQSHCIDRLTGLPSELLVRICDLLSPVDIVCLCLCNHRFYNLFQTYYRFPTLRDDKLSIFIRLERDLPEYFACDICNFLHRYDGSESFGLSGTAHETSSGLPCVRKGYDWHAECIGGSSISMRTHVLFPHSKNRLYFLQVKLAMRRHCYGPYSGINTDSLAFTQVREYIHPWQKSQPSSIYRSIRNLFSIEAQVCSEPLGVHIRMQDIVLHDMWEDSKIQVNSKSYSLWYYEICQHTSLESKASDIESVYNGEKSSFPYTCPRCNTVSLIEFRRIDSRLALVMTRWINLGSGIHRDDPLWKIHVFTCNDGTMPYELPISLMLQSPRTCFENTTSLSFEDLRSRNISYLRDDRYKKGGAFVSDKANALWHMSYKEPSKGWGIFSLFS